MKSLSKTLFILILFYFSLPASIFASSAPEDKYYQSKATGNWNATSTWLVSNNQNGPFSDATEPPSATNSTLITIIKGHEVTVDSLGQTASSLVLEDTSKLIVTDSKTLQISGHWTNDGTFTAETSSTVTFSGGNDQTIVGSGTTTFHNLVIDNSSADGVFIHKSIIINGNMDINQNCKLKLIEPPGGVRVITIKGNWTNNGDFDSQLNTKVIFDGTQNDTISGTGTTTFRSLIIENLNENEPKNINLDKDIFITHLLQTNANTILIPGSDKRINPDISPLQGTITGNGTIHVNRTETGDAKFKSQYRFSTYSLDNLTVDFSAPDGMQTIEGNPIQYGILKISNNNPDGVNTDGNTINVDSTFITSSDAIVHLGSSQLKAKYVIHSGTLKTQNESNSPIPSGKTWSGTVEYNKSDGLQIIVEGTYDKLKLSNSSGTNTTSGSIEAKEFTTVAGGTIDIGIDTLSLTIGGSINHQGLLMTKSTNLNPIPTGINWDGTIKYYGANQYIASGTYKNLIISAAGNKTALGNITATNLDNGDTSNVASVLDMGEHSLVINTSGSIDNTNSTIKFSGVENGIAVATGTVVYNGDDVQTPQTVKDGSYSNLTLSGQSEKIASDTIVVYDLLKNSSVFDMSDKSLTANDSINNEGGTIKFSGAENGIAVATGTVVYNGDDVQTPQTVKDGSYSNLTLSGSGNKSFPSSVTINGMLSREGAASVTGSVPSYGVNSTIQYKGSINQTTGDEWPATFDASGGVVIDNSNHVTLNGQKSIQKLTLKNGRINLSDNHLTTNTIIADGGDFSTSRMIVTNGLGELRIRINENGSKFFPVGDASGNVEYSPVELEFNSGTYTSNAHASVRVINSKHPNNNSSQHFLKRYWEVASEGITGYDCNFTGTFNEADINGTIDSMISGQWAGQLPWVKNDTIFVSEYMIKATGIIWLGDFTGITKSDPTVTISASPAIQVCTGQSVSLTANPDGDPTFSYSWSPGGQTTQSIDVTAPNPGQQNISVMVTDGNGFTAQEQVTIIIHPQPQWSVNSVTPTQSCLEHPITLNASVSGGMGGDVIWKRSTNSINWVTVFSPNTPPSAGTYHYRPEYNATGAGCALTPGIETSIVVEPDPLIVTQPVSPDAICVDDTTYMSLAASGGISPLSYQWQYKHNGNWISVTNGTPTGAKYGGNMTQDLVVWGIEAEGDYDYRCRVTSNPDLSCDPVESNTAKVTVADNLIVDIVIETDPVGAHEVCEGTGVVFTANTENQGSAPTYQWKRNGEDIPDATSPSLSFTPENGDTFTCVLVSSVNCAVQNTVESPPVMMTVNPLPGFEIDGPINVCQNMYGVEYIITNDTNLSFSESQFQWSIPAEYGIIQDTNTGFIRVDWLNMAGEQDITLTITNEKECMSSNQLPVTILSTVAPEPDSLVIKEVNNKPVVIIYPVPGLSYEWYINDSKIEDETKQYLYLTTDLLKSSGDSTVFMARVEPKDNLGGTTCGNFSFPYIYNPTGKSLAFGEADYFQLYPNPAAGEVYVTVNEEVAGDRYEQIELRIFDNTGNTLNRQSITTWETRVDVGRLARGLYFAELIMNGYSFQTRKLIIH